MRYLVLSLALLAACTDTGGPNPIEPPPPPPPPPLDPATAVHAINQQDSAFNAWTIVIGVDGDHTGFSFQGTVHPDTSVQFHGPFCLWSRNTRGNRTFTEAAVIPNSALDVYLQSLTQTRAQPIRDSLAQGLLDAATILARRRGLLIATPAFDPAPDGFTPADTIPWTWTLTPTNETTVVVDTSDHACH